MTSFAVLHNATLDRFEVTVEGHLCVIDYQQGDGVVRLTHVGVPRPVGNRGIAAALTQAALDWARAEGLRVVPLCPYVIAWLRRHRDYRSLIQPL